MKEICSEDIFFLDNTFCINYCLNLQFPKNLLKPNGFIIKSNNYDENRLFIKLAEEKEFILERANTPFFELYKKIHEVLINEIESKEELKNLTRYQNGFYLTIKEKKEELTKNLTKLDKKLSIIDLESLTDEKYNEHKAFFNQFTEEKKEFFAKINKDPIPEKEDLVLFNYMINKDEFVFFISADTHFIHYEINILQNYNVQVINEFKLSSINKQINGN